MPGEHDQLQRRSGNPVSVHGCRVQLRECHHATRDQSPGHKGHVRGLPGTIYPTSGKQAGQYVPLQDAQLPRLVHLRGQRQSVQVPRVYDRKLPHVQSNSRRA
uniref:(northern house mosquito) hypothetical protein n=1 Tax=Culex pipiens TaxID=7175 RepID=A0A8D8L4R7_CULPI